MRRKKNFKSLLEMTVNSEATLARITSHVWFVVASLRGVGNSVSRISLQKYVPVRKYAGKYERRAVLCWDIYRER